MVYQAIFALSKPTSIPVLSLINSTGGLAKLHPKEERISINAWAPSKSSKYVVVSPLKSAFFGELGLKKATSPLKDKLEGTSVSMFGNLLANRVRNGISVLKLPFSPKMVLLTGSMP